MSKRPGAERKKSFIFSMAQPGSPISQGTGRKPESGADFLPAQAWVGCQHPVGLAVVGPDNNCHKLPGVSHFIINTLKLLISFAFP